MSAVENRKFGATLRAARENNNISVSHIAETLKLSIDIIENIEASNTAVLPPAAFTCGYIRSFAKLVEVNEEEAVHLYNQSIGVESFDAALSVTSDLPTQATSNDLSMRVASYSLGLVAVVLFVVWFQSTQEESEVPVVNIESTEAPVVNVESSEVLVNESVASEDRDLTISELPLIEEAPVEIVTESNVESDSNLIVSDITVIETNELVASDEVDTDELKKDKIITLSKKANPVASSGTDVVVLTAKDDCWVEISDANNQLLYFSLLKKGEITQLQGQEPFSVFLGKANSVVITLNDIQYDASKYVRSNQIARFTMSMDKLLENQVKQDVINDKNSDQEND